jgi:hypothetical protein
LFGANRCEYRRSEEEVHFFLETNRLQTSSSSSKLHHHQNICHHAVDGFFVCLFAGVIVGVDWSIGSEDKFRHSETSNYHSKTTNVFSEDFLLADCIRFESTSKDR